MDQTIQYCHDCAQCTDTYIDVSIHCIIASSIYLHTYLKLELKYRYQICCVLFSYICMLYLLLKRIEAEIMLIFEHILIACYKAFIKQICLTVCVRWQCRDKIAIQHHFIGIQLTLVGIQHFLQHARQQRVSQCDCMMCFCLSVIAYSLSVSAIASQEKYLT